MVEAGMESEIYESVFNFIISRGTQKNNHLVVIALLNAKVNLDRFDLCFEFFRERGNIIGDEKVVIALM